MKILLIGNPNVGKSAIFSHLTGVSVTISNYPGTTVQYTKGYLTHNGKQHEVIDVPGTYQIESETKAEKVAADMISSGDVLVNVVDATNLERNLNLTLQLMEIGKPMVLVLNMWDDAMRKGIEVDVVKLEKLLRIPVITTNGNSGEGLAKLPDKCLTARYPHSRLLSTADRWKTIGSIVRQVQNLSHRRHTFIEKLQDLSVHFVYGPIIAIGLLFLIFKIIIALGETLIGFMEKLFEQIYTPLITQLSNILGNEGILHALLLGDLNGGQIDYEAAMGVLTTGIFVAFGVVLPYITVFYLIFGFLEDLGYLPRVAVILDRALHRIGLHGYSVIPMLLGCGCNVPGVLAIRNLETRRERFITAVLTCTTIPCMAQTSLIIKAVGQRGGAYIALVFVTLFTVWAIIGLFLNRSVKGKTPTLVLEVPPYRLPSLNSQFKKLWMRIKCFLKEAIPYVLGGILLINLFHVSGVIAWIGDLFSPIITGIFGLPKETVAPLIIGTFRKDAAVALLEPIGLTSMQIVTAAVILTLYFPCVATFTVLFKELGINDTFKAIAIMFGFTAIAGGGLHILSRAYSPLAIIVIELGLVVVLLFVVPFFLRQYKHPKSNVLDS